MGTIDTANQLGMFDNLAYMFADTLTKPEKVDIPEPTHQANQHIEPVIIEPPVVKSADPLLNKSYKVPVIPDTVLRADVDRNDLFYNLNRMND